MAMSLNTERYQDDNAVIDHTPSSAVTGGDIVAPGGGLITYADRDIAASEKGAVALTGLRKYKKDGTSGPTFSVGDTIYFDNSTEQAVAPGLALDGSADYEVAVCVEAAVTGQDFVIGMPTQVLDRYNVIRPLVYEFDVSTDNGDTDEHVLIPAWQNRHGLVLVQAYGIVTEQPVGDSQDQGEVTIEDSDDNTLSVLITTDTSPDAVDDVVIGSNGLWGASTGDAVPKTAAAGKAIQGYVSQQTNDSGTAAGKLKVYLIVQPLV